MRVDFALGTAPITTGSRRTRAGASGQVLRGDDAFFLRGDKAEPMGVAARRDLQRELLHEPVLLLRRIDEPGVVAVAGERSKVGDDAVQLVTVWIDGLSITLGIADDGRIRSCSATAAGVRNCGLAPSNCTTTTSARRIAPRSAERSMASRRPA
ncbi:MAG: hypothetical protein IPK26_13595 [Planctomycetes bacterium]|nr:hypothetical protein [Planctomycetota bacterium]